MFAYGDHVHLVLDHAQRHGSSPKDVERSRRDHFTDESTNCTDPQLLGLAKPCPTGDNWCKMLGCRSCKRNLINMISNGTMLLMQVQPIQPGQTLVTAGGFEGELQDQSWSVKAGQAPCQLPFLKANHEEADTRVWFHASKFSRAIIYSPDTDTFMIGLPQFSNTTCLL